jgi:hypothetical protein
VIDFGPAVTEDPWNRIRLIVHDEALRARGRIVPTCLQTLARRRDDDANGRPAGPPEGEHSFWVSQRFVLRERDDTAIALIQP